MKPSHALDGTLVAERGLCAVTVPGATALDRLAVDDDSPLEVCNSASRTIGIALPIEGMPLSMTMEGMPLSMTMECAPFISMTADGTMTDGDKRATPALAQRPLWADENPWRETESNRSTSSSFVCDISVCDDDKGTRKRPTTAGMRFTVLLLACLLLFGNYYCMKTWLKEVIESADVQLFVSRI